MIHVHLGFRDRKLKTIVLSTEEDTERALDCDYYIDHPKEPDKQVEEWVRKQGFNLVLHKKEGSK